MSGTRDRLAAVMFDLVAADGLDRLSVREVASRAGVSIGAVQHHFATKDAMLVAAFEELVARTRARLATTTWGEDQRANVRTALAQLLPLDADRAAEARVHLAFAARAAVTPELADVQSRVLCEVVAELAQTLPATVADPTSTARLLLAAADGLALHAVSSRDPGSSSAALLDALAEILLDAGGYGAR